MSIETSISNIKDKVEFKPLSEKVTRNLNSKEQEELRNARIKASAELQDIQKSLDILKQELSPDTLKKLSEEDLKESLEIKWTLDKIMDETSDIWEAWKKIVTNPKETAVELFAGEEVKKWLSFFEKIEEKWDQISEVWKNGDFIALIKMIFSGDFLDFHSLKEKFTQGLEKIQNILKIDDTTFKNWKNFLINSEEYSKQFGELTISQIRGKLSSLTPLSDLGITGGNNEEAKLFIGSIFTEENYKKILDAVNITSAHADNMRLSEFIGKVGK